MTILLEQMPHLDDIRCTLQCVTKADVRKHLLQLLFCDPWYRLRESHAHRITSDCLLDGFIQLDRRRIAQQLTSLSVALGCTIAEARWQADADMLAALAQLSELRQLDVGNCLFLPADGARPDLHDMPSSTKVPVIRQILTRYFRPDIERHNRIVCKMRTNCHVHRVCYLHSAVNAM